MEVLDGITFKNMIIKGAQVLNNNFVEINSLNVFPVPDGDTGTNMKLTLGTAVKELNKVSHNSVQAVASAVAQGSLMGARGNSGVILSQLFRGFARGINNKEELSKEDFAMGLMEGTKTAYKAVMRPVEGTILTVAKSAAEMAVETSGKKGFIDMMEAILKQAEETLDQTPEMLSVLKEAGVVDAGGKGLCYLYHGFLSAMKGEIVEESDMLNLSAQKEAAAGAVVGILAAKKDIQFTYCTELIIKGKNIDLDRLKKSFKSLGDSILVVGDPSLTKIHIHTNSPGIILQASLREGDLHDIKIENMHEQHSNILSGGLEEWQPSAPSEGKKDLKAVSIIAVVNGDGLRRIFHSFGVDKVIKGGQTMNPSTEDFLQTINEMQAKKVIILPNNKNVIMAARQVAPLCESEVYVIPSCSIPQGIAALLQYDNYEDDIDRLAQKMELALTGVKTGEITVAVRNSQYNGEKIKEGEIIGLINGKLALVKHDLEQVVEELLKRMVEPDHEIITIYYGENILEEETAELQDRLQELYPQLDIEVCNGGQPLYPYIISVE